MCITVKLARLTNTKILSLPLENGRHFIAYSNKVKNTSGEPNAMILPIPGETKQEWFDNTESYKGFLEEIADNCDLHENYMGIRSRGISKGMGILSAGYDHFELGMYTIGLSKDIDALQGFIQSQPEEKRPEISDELLSFFKEKYAGWSFAVCLFGSDKAIDAQPIAFEYVPFDYNLVYFPTIDGHDGKAPDLNDHVLVDHTFLYEHTGPMIGDFYMQKSVTLKADVPAFLKERRYREQSYQSHLQNGDTFVDGNKMKELEFRTVPDFKRIQPVPYLV